MLEPRDLASGVGPESKARECFSAPESKCSSEQPRGGFRLPRGALACLGDQAIKTVDIEAFGVDLEHVADLAGRDRAPVVSEPLS